jgi:L-ascorbate metabolism protein UlaG (beta-lactamase superfamily)
MKIKYTQHSGFILEDDTLKLVIDCCGLTKEDKAALENTGKRLYILASHVHSDHFDPKIMTIGGAQRKFVLSGDIRKKTSSRESDRRDTHFLVKGEVYQDEYVKIKAYGSTDEGVSFYIEAGGLKIFHAGDLNNWHWNEEETPEDAAKNEQAFLDELALIAREVPALDAAMFPVDPRLGKDHTRGAEQFLDSIKVGLFIPMHFWGDFDAARAFKPIAEQRGCCFAEIHTARDIFELN